MKTIHLQSIGKVNAIEAVELKIGDRTIWNFGGIETIISVVAETPCFITFKIRCEETGNLHERRLKKTRLVGISKRAKQEKPRVTYRQVKKALKRGWKSPLNNRDGAFELPSFKVVPVKRVFSIVVFEGGRYIPAQGENVSGFGSMKEAYKRSCDFHQVSKVLEHGDNDASFYQELRNLNGE